MSVRSGCEDRGEYARDDACQQRDRGDRQRRRDAGRPQALDELAGELTGAGSRALRARTQRRGTVPLRLRTRRLRRVDHLTRLRWGQRHPRRCSRSCGGARAGVRAGLHRLVRRRGVPREQAPPLSRRRRGRRDPARVAHGAVGMSVGSLRLCPRRVLRGGARRTDPRVEQESMRRTLRRTSCRSSFSRILPLVLTVTGCPIQASRPPAPPAVLAVVVMPPHRARSGPDSPRVRVRRPRRRRAGARRAEPNAAGGLMATRTPRIPGPVASRPPQRRRCHTMPRRSCRCPRVQARPATSRTSGRTSDRRRSAHRSGGRSRGSSGFTTARTSRVRHLSAQPASGAFAMQRRFKIRPRAPDRSARRRPRAPRRDRPAAATRRRRPRRPPDAGRPAGRRAGTGARRP